MVPVSTYYYLHGTVGSIRGIPADHQQTECYPPQECTTELEVPSVWLPMLLLHSWTVIEPSFLPE